MKLLHCFSQTKAEPNHPNASSAPFPGSRHSRLAQQAEPGTRVSDHAGNGVLSHSCTTTTTIRNLVFSHSIHIRTNPSFRARTQRDHPHFIFPSPLPFQTLSSTLRSLTDKCSLVHGSPRKKKTPCGDAHMRINAHILPLSEEPSKHVCLTEAVHPTPVIGVTDTS